ncbi:unnamed protein product [Citrullus colocynthis]|uniref:Uncharacterized protein n=1 Tax=Citrullus colocynthis TaxID=252529 RepID=A0ABP0XUZ9_9ROSI
MVESRPNPETSLATRLKLDVETSDCWGTLHELQACTGYTTEEGDILETYCDTTVDGLTTLSSPLSLSTKQNIVDYESIAP